MFTWGEDSQRGFRIKNGSNISESPAEDGVHHLQLGYHITALSAAHSLLAFIKRNGNSFIIRTNESKDGGRVRGKQKFVKECKEKIQAVSCGDDVVTLLSERGKVLCVDPTRSYIARPLEALSQIAVCQVACGSQHSVALTKDGQVYTWGQDSRGQLGLGKRKPGTNSPQHLRCLSAIPLVQIAAGGEQSLALSVSGGVFSWGRNHCGQLGLGHMTDRHTPTPVHNLNMKKTIHISCGKDHTAVLTKDGAVFTFGSGQYGQLGHNSFSNQPRPRLVAELWGAKVTKIACGRHHTLVMTDSKRLYSFGCGEQGQLGHGEETHPSVPLPVHLPQDTTDDLNIRNIFAGGNCSYATCTANEDIHEEAHTDSVNNVTQHCLDDVIDRWTSECDPKSWKKIKQEIHRMFSSASCLNGSFLKKSKDQHFQTSPKYSGLDLSLARHAFKKLVKKDRVFAEVEAAVLHLLPSLEEQPVGVEGLRVYLLLTELLHVIQRLKRQQNSTKLAEAVAAAVLNLSADNLQIVGDWWSLLSPSTKLKHIKVWKKAFSVILSSDPVPRNSGVRNLLLILQSMYNVNSRSAEPQKLPDSDFCLLIDSFFIEDDLEHWRQSQRRNAHAQPLILCSFPALMDLESKKFAFDLDATYSKEEASCPNHLFWDFWSFFLPTPSLLFKLALRRASVLEDTFKILAAAPQKLFKLPLLVVFDRSYKEDDRPLYIKDFFYDVFHELVSAESGMFMFNDSKRLAWFPSNAKQEEQKYFLCGVLCGLALYHQHIIHFPFPLALFKKLLGVKPSLQDMIELSPSVGRSLLNILKDEDEDTGLDFTIFWDGAEVELDPKNPGKPVTGQNKKEFVDAYVHHVFNASVEGVFHEFRRGFFQVCERDLVKLFKPEELQQVLVGQDFTDWAKLKQNTDYEGEYQTSPPHPTIQMFWEVFDELTEDQKKAFLWFVTGFDRVPIVGMGDIKMKVKVKKAQDLSYDQDNPETHTCFSTLELPLYSTKEILRTKLTEALSRNRKLRCIGTGL
ncbi:probable E3 ubiquitin-protein ligase HERC3 [Centropristis striata]|uniref:probable E3 ubiquitin-protein ligase HERC3 n=1 Tax=Centropristis striata TaxID=184440 RepID=UPI0027DFEC88|nr:probable E3 ubiquitin-protein ligase HERC3 [Centropristis striata]